MVADSRSFFIRTKMSIASWLNACAICLIVGDDGDTRAIMCAKNDHVYY